MQKSAEDPAKTDDQTPVEQDNTTKDEPPQAMTDLTLTTEHVTLSANASSAALDMRVDAQMGQDVSVVDWTDLREKFAAEGAGFLKDSLTDENGVVQRGGVTRENDLLWSDGRFYFVEIGPVDPNFQSHDVVSFGNETLHLGSWYGPSKNLFARASPDLPKVAVSFADRATTTNGKAPKDMTAIRDFDGKDLGAGEDWKLIGQADVHFDGDAEFIYINQTNGRWATVGPDSTGKVDFSDQGQGGETRVVGIYNDPEVEKGNTERFGPHDCQ